MFQDEKDMKKWETTEANVLGKVQLVQNKKWMELIGKHKQQLRAPKQMSSAK